jgi:hypothetical protein
MRRYFLSLLFGGWNGSFRGVVFKDITFQLESIAENHLFF